MDARKTGPLLLVGRAKPAFGDVGNGYTIIGLIPSHIAKHNLSVFLVNWRSLQPTQMLVGQVAYDDARRKRANCEQPLVRGAEADRILVEPSRRRFNLPRLVGQELQARPILFGRCNRAAFTDSAKDRRMRPRRR